MNSPRMISVPLSFIQDNPFNIRTVYDEKTIDALKTSIANMRDSIAGDTWGLIHVPMGRIVDDDDMPIPVTIDELADLNQADETTWEMAGYHVQLAHGHCRRRAFSALAAGKPRNDHTWDYMPVRIADLSDRQMHDLTWAENEHRADVDPISRAEWIQAYMAEYDINITNAAANLGLARSTASNLIRLLKLPDSAQDWIRTGRMSERQGRALLPLLNIKRGIYHLGLDYAEIADRSVSYLESDVTATIAENTAEITTAPWSPYDTWKSAGVDTGIPSLACGECPMNKTIAKVAVCCDLQCWANKTESWRIEYIGPATARNLVDHLGAHNWIKTTEKIPTKTGIHCAACGRAAYDHIRITNWRAPRMARSSTWICPTCWELADLPAENVDPPIVDAQPAGHVVVGNLPAAQPSEPAEGAEPSPAPVDDGSWPCVVCGEYQAGSATAWRRFDDVGPCCQSCANGTDRPAGELVAELWASQPAAEGDPVSLETAVNAENIAKLNAMRAAEGADLPAPEIMPETPPVSLIVFRITEDPAEDPANWTVQAYTGAEDHRIMFSLAMGTIGDSQKYAETPACEIFDLLDHMLRLLDLSEHIAPPL